MTVRDDVAYDLAVRALDEQRSAVDGLRTRAGLILAIAAIVNVELARQAFDGVVTQQMFAAGGLVCAGLAGFLLGQLCLGQPMVFGPPVTDILSRSKPYDIDDLHLKSALAQAMAKVKVTNELTLAHLSRLLSASVVLLAISAGCWIITIATRK